MDKSRVEEDDSISDLKDDSIYSSSPSSSSSEYKDNPPRKPKSQ